MFSMLELAPNHKAGISVVNPILLGGGVIGCAEGMQDSLKVAGCGAVVVGPFTRSSRRGRSPRRLAEGLGSFILDTGLQNRGVRGSIKRFGRVWGRLGVPVIAQIADSDPEDALRSADLLERSDSIAGLELLVHAETSAGDLSALVDVLVLEGELPIWVKLPYASATTLAMKAVEAGTNGLVVSQPPIGVLKAMSSSGLAAGSGFDYVAQPVTDYVSGPLHGPPVFPLMLRNLAEIASQDLGVPLIASGGIYSWHDAETALTAGASAVQLDSAVWVEPGLPGEIVRGWEEARSSDLLQ